MNATADSKPRIYSKAFGMTRWQLDAWHADVTIKRIPEPYRSLQMNSFKNDFHGTVYDGYLVAESAEAIAFVRGWLVGRQSIA